MDNKFTLAASQKPVSEVPEHLSDVPSKRQGKRSFGGRVASVFLLVIPHIVTHIGLGAAKGIELGATRPADFLNHHCKKIGEPDSKISAIGGHAGRIFGAIVGIVTAVPGLLIGTVVGLGRIIYKFPEAVRTCWGESVGAALCQTARFYKVDPERVIVAVGTTVITAAMSCSVVITAGACIPVFVAIDVIAIVALSYTLYPVYEESESKIKKAEEDELEEVPEQTKEEIEKS